MPDHFCIVSDHAKLKFSFDRHNVSPSADSYYWPCMYIRTCTCMCMKKCFPLGRSLASHGPSAPCVSVLFAY